MQSLPTERNTQTIYRVDRSELHYENQTLYTVSVFAESLPPVTKTTCRFDMLPQWMQDAIAMLDTAGKGVTVPNVGRRIGDTYWLGAHQLAVYVASLYDWMLPQE